MNAAVSSPAVSMDEAARCLNVSRRFLQDLVKVYPFYCAAGRRKVFREKHIRGLFAAMEFTKPADLRAIGLGALAATGRVYFIEGQITRNIKIGFTAADTKTRLWDLTTGSSEQLTLLGTFPGSREDEAALHRYFATHRIKGEWFSPEIEACVCLFLARLADGAAE